MCGLVAVISRRGGAPPERMREALGSLLHRGPDAQDMLFERLSGEGRSADASVALGHARLSIIDLDPRSNQPFTDGGHTLAYNGEIYNFRELREDMRRAGEAFRTQGDAEVLLRLLSREGPEGLLKANGMWAFCWLDRKRRRVTVGRDRYGKKPLFYVANDERICLASEIGALLAISDEAAQARSGAVAAFLAEGWMFPRADGETHLRGVREVRPGECIEIDLSNWTLTAQTACDVAVDAPPANASSPHQLAELLADAISKRLISDRKVGLLLSGGVDSSLILSVLAAKKLLDGVVCITGDAGKSEDASFAKRCLDAVGKRATTAPMDYGDAAFDRFLDACARQEKPFPLIGNVLGMAALYAAIGAEGVRVVLDGTGGDEIFGGYWSRQAGFAMRDAARAGDEAWLSDIRAGGLLPDDLAAAKGEALLRRPPPSPARETLSPADRALLTDRGRREIDAAPTCDPLIGFDGDLKAALALDARRGRMQEWLWQNDRNAMAASVENRSPFLDHRLGRYMATPYHAKFGGRWNKRELRSLFAHFTHLPTSTRADKQGFRWVYGRFARANRGKIRDLLASSRLVRKFVELDRCRWEPVGADPYVDSRILPRALVIAGLEAVGRLN